MNVPQCLFNNEYLVLDAHPEDSGFWACRILNDEEGELFMSQEVEITVYGEICYLSIYYMTASIW